ncbi:MAG: glucokinase [Cyanobacteria bacterium CRU_2_1]|nr:glucokinase [Cyanobacteria bacterium RU_5_0]NJR58193.1 glucokinase [Cyanobacteria bacterium CRU_2_1]
MTQILAGDTGGTKTILLLAEPQETETGIKLKLLHEQRYISAEFPDLVPMVRMFLAEAKMAIGTTPAPEKACFSIAGPIVNNTSNLTNLSWLLDGERLQQDLTISHIQLINDFAAVGYGIAGLERSDIDTLQEGEYQPNAPIAVIGAGTGLGQGFLIRYSDGYHIYPSEGGHTDFAPRNELEFQLLKYLRDKLNLSRISVERVVSGMGIVAIYQFLRDRQCSTESPDIAEAIRTWEREAGMSEKTVDPAAVIGRAAAEGRDRLCEETMRLFVDLYGAEAGNLALKLLPYGGLYIAGGIAAKNLPLMKSGIFIKSMTDKGRMSRLMERVPVHVILNQEVGLLGAALYAAKS